ncbi:flagellar biosynthetic protein FliP [Sulfurivirga caldicuralii]|uniref:Flagellar biosynthetic protein FliP n=1 Tax=Sulfurivirga caldicuralii TaxID=364032 RepID=A0A1N6FLG5_9GAMM|nr:flagellar type III secretion system pore protein FliP [Sulfurivirga caldicuralii]SIN96040.1 flagellar biosynthetic protein FliP [Sulfurivirga caldicuralii]
MHYTAKPIVTTTARKLIRILPFLLLFWPWLAQAAPGIPAFTVSVDEQGNQDYTLTIQILLIMTGLTLLPAALIATTSFLRIIIVLALLRQALGTMQTPSNQVLIGLALFLTLFIMAPVLDKIYTQAVSPYMEETITFKEAVERASKPMHTFMLQQTREDDLGMFAEMAGVTLEQPETVPFKVLIPAFMTSELKTAFQIGFMIFIPFLIIDLVIASLLMSMGMMMLSPMIISLPFKIMLFVLVDGWELILGTLVNSFIVPGSGV